MKVTVTVGDIVIKTQGVEINVNKNRSPATEDDSVSSRAVAKRRKNDFIALT